MKRKLIWAGIVLVVLFLAYRTWPIVSAAQLAAAVERGAVEAVNERIDFPTLRRALGRQIARAYLDQTGKAKELSALERGAAIGAGTSVAEAYLAEVLTAETLIAFLKTGRIDRPAVLGQPMALDERLPRFSQLLRTDLIAVVLFSYFEGPMSFMVVADDSAATTAKYGLLFRLSGLTWRLSELDLPRALREQLAGELMDREEKDGSAR